MGEVMTGPTDIAVNLAITKLKLILDAAENSNHAGEVAAVRAAEAWTLESAIRLVLPEIRNSLSCGDGRFTAEQIETIEDALSAARGEVRLAIDCEAA